MGRTMSAVEKISKARTPKAALLVLAQEIDQLRADMAKQVQVAADPWAGWDSDEEFTAAGELEDEAIHVSVDAVKQWNPETEEFEGDDPANPTITIKSPTDEKYELRDQFAKWRLHIDDYYSTTPTPTPKAANEDSKFDTWAEVYDEAGPYWWWNADRDAVMSYDLDIRKAMVEDVEDDSPALARLMAADILKASADETEYGQHPSGSHGR